MSEPAPPLLAQLLDPTPAAWAELGRELACLLSKYAQERDELPIGWDRCVPAATELDVQASAPESSMQHAQSAGGPVGPLAALRALAAASKLGQTHTASRRYFGLLQTAPAPLAAMTDALFAFANPQLATERTARFAAQTERELLRQLGARVGMPHATGSFTHGGAEANHTALVAALMRAFPEVARRGVRALRGNPLLYCSSEAHGSLVKAARAAGIGEAAVRRIAVDQYLQFQPGKLREAIARDRRAGDLPFMVVATAGTTATGTMEPVRELAQIAKEQQMWFHVDAAWGALLAMRSRQGGNTLLDWHADSLTWDAHKTLPVPLTTSMLLVQNADDLQRAFHCGSGYMPTRKSADNYATSMRWSRSVLGMRLQVLIEAYGWPLLEAHADRVLYLGEYLQRQLLARGHRMPYPTQLPVASIAVGGSKPRRTLDEMRKAALTQANAWVSVSGLSTGQAVLRACVNHPRTTESDIDALVAALEPHA